jgi:hypothetical protein
MPLWYLFYENTPKASHAPSTDDGINPEKIVIGDLVSLIVDLTNMDLERL